MYQPQAQDPTNAYDPSCSQPPCDKYQMSLGPTNETDVDNVDKEAFLNQSMATLAASAELYHGLSDVEVPSMRPHTIQCDPWCSAAMNRQVHSSDMPSWDPHAKCGGIFPRDIVPEVYMTTYGPNPSLVIPPLTSKALPDYHPRCRSFVTNSSGWPTPKSATTEAGATGEIVGYPRRDDGSLMTIPQGVPSGFASAKNPSDIVYPPLVKILTSLSSCLPIPNGDGHYALGAEDAGLAPRVNAEQEHTLKMNSIAGRWPLGTASPDNPEGLVPLPWNSNATSSYPHLPLPKDDGTPVRLHVSGFAPPGDGEQYHTLDRGLKAEHGPSAGPSEYCVPLEYLPARRSNPRRKRRRFTNGEKAVISYKRKMGVCGDCRQAKRKCTHVQLDMGNEAPEMGAGVISTQPQGSSVFDGSRLSKISAERQNSNIQEQGLDCPSYDAITTC